MKFLISTVDKRNGNPLRNLKVLDAKNYSDAATQVRQLYPTVYDCLLLTDITQTSKPVTEQEMRAIYVEAFGKEFDSEDRKQLPLPIDIAYIVAIRKLSLIEFTE